MNFRNARLFIPLHNEKRIQPFNKSHNIMWQYTSFIHGRKPAGIYPAKDYCGIWIGRQPLNLFLYRIYVEEIVLYDYSPRVVTDSFSFYSFLLSLLNNE